MAEETQKGGFVFYPRNYTVNGDDYKTHYVEGVNQQGQQCVVYIHPQENFVHNARNTSSANNIPSLAQFAQTHRKAQTPCAASSDNSPAAPAGVLLIEQACKADAEISAKHKHPAFIARWASILSEGDYMPAPLVGKGYLELNFHNTESDANTYRREQWFSLKKELNAGLITEDRIHEVVTTMESLYEQYIQEQTKWFVGVVVEHQCMEDASGMGMSDVESTILRLLNRETPPGLYRGVMVRIRRGDIVSYKASCVASAQYNYKEKRPQTAEEVLGFFMSQYRANIQGAINRGDIIELIPTLRVNCGKKGNEKYGKEINPMGKVQKVYIDKRFHNSPGNYAKLYNGFLYADVAIRLAEINSHQATKGNLLLSTIHAFSSPQGNVLTMDREGNSIYTMNFKTDNASEKPAEAA